MTTTSKKHGFAWLGSSVVLALGLVLCANASAQGGAPRITVAGSEDMQLWSFGDCDRRFPYFDTDEHKECVRVVGSPEARDARALRVCEVSHQPDLVEIERCKSAYQANKEKAVRDGLVANEQTAQASSLEMMRTVKAITTAAVEEQRAAALAAAPAAAVAAPEPLAPEANAESSSSWTRPVAAVMLVAIIVGLGISLVRRKQAQSA